MTAVTSCLESIVSGDYPHGCLEVMVVDGRSEDGTRDIIEAYEKRYKFIRLLNNDKKTTPVGLNIGITMARGEYIIILSSHSKIHSDFIRQNVEQMETTQADCVGGCIVTLPGRQTEMSRAIAFSLSNSFGVGNSSFRTGVSNTKEVDTVPYGCYRKQVFHQVGLFNENLIRNQDIEFNLRLKRQGGKILLVPAIISYYSARNTIGDLLKQSFANGFWVIYGAGFTRLPFSVRHVVPLLWVGSLLTLSAAAFYNPLCLGLVLLMITLYVGVNTAVSVRVAWSKGVKTCLCLVVAFATLHFGYGAGSLWGLIKLAQLTVTHRWQQA